MLIQFYKYTIINNTVYWLNTKAERSFAARIMSINNRSRSDVFLTRTPNSTLRKANPKKDSYIGTIDKYGNISTR